jgi:membrane associated rhomboid family serine protease
MAALEVVVKDDVPIRPMLIAPMTATTDRITTKIQILGTFVTLAWLVPILSTYFSSIYSLRWYGIIPRQPLGLRGILFAPFLHEDVTHLLIDTIPFVALGWAIMARSIANFTPVSLMCLGISGLGIWLTGYTSKVSYIIGGGGLIYGYISYLLALYCSNRRSIGSAVVALAIGCTYIIVRASSSSWSLSGNLWQEAVFGCVGGLVAARLVYKK